MKTTDDWAGASSLIPEWESWDNDVADSEVPNKSRKTGVAVKEETGEVDVAVKEETDEVDVQEEKAADEWVGAAASKLKLDQSGPSQISTPKCKLAASPP